MLNAYRVFDEWQKTGYFKSENLPIFRQENLKNKIMK